jgi:predicted transcriptional regulator YheO
MFSGLPPTQSLHTLTPASAARSPVVENKDLSNESYDIVRFSGKGSGEYRDALRLLANQLGVSEASAYRILRRVAQTGELANLSFLRKISAEIIQAKNEPELAKRIDAEKSSTDLSENSGSTKEQIPLDATYKARFNLLSSNDSLKESLSQLRSLDNQNRTTFNKAELLSELTYSPKQFASWLVNNKSAFASLKYYPEITYLLIGLQSPGLELNPSLLSEISKLLANLIKLKQGKSVSESQEEEKLEEREKQILQENADHLPETVSDITNTTRTVEVNPLRDFLIEAERFAEEEVANLWSLMLKKEKEIEQKILEKFKSLS